MKQVLVSAAALVSTQGELLVAQRPVGKSMAGLWEFPGGKVEHGESPEAALVRELREELAIEVDERDCQALEFVSHAYDDFHLLMLLYGVRQWQGAVSPQENQAVQWVNPQALTALPMPPADEPLLECVQRFMTK